MSNIVKINYINKSTDRDPPKILLCLKNDTPTLDVLRDGVEWKVIEDVDCGSSCQVNSPTSPEVATSGDDHTCQTAMLPSSSGCRYSVLQDDTSIVLNFDGNAGNTRPIDVANSMYAEDDASVDLYKDGRSTMAKGTVAHGWETTFNVHPKIYFRLASEALESGKIDSSMLNSDNFFEQNLGGVSAVTVALCGNAEDGYQFKIESQK